eukprot:26398-Eustigmatos_ZCMA.PRE.1
MVACLHLELEQPQRLAWFRTLAVHPSSQRKVSCTCSSTTGVPRRLYMEEEVGEQNNMSMNESYDFHP